MERAAAPGNESAAQRGRVVTALRVASLFAGCGGSSIGYRAAGLRVAYACEWDDVARETYELNAPRGFRVDGRDVREVRGSDLPEIDVLDGSPPCQPFTTAGARRGAADERDMFPEYVRLVGEVRPRAFVCENVPGLAMGKALPYLRRIVRGLRDAGYAVRARIVEAEWHGGAADEAPAGDRWLPRRPPDRPR